MSFCPECGRQLSDGEVCNCQAQNTQQVQPDAQTQSIQQVQPDAQTQSTQQAPKQTSPMVKELTDLLSGIFKKPADEKVCFQCINGSTGNSYTCSCIYKCIR